MNYCGQLELVPEGKFIYKLPKKITINFITYTCYNKIYVLYFFRNSCDYGMHLTFIFETIEFLHVVYLSVDVYNINTSGSFCTPKYVIDTNELHI